jgi:hypothetical protein
MDLQSAIKHAIDGNAMIFTGTGFSYQATNMKVKDNEFLMGLDFNNYLCDLIGIEHDEDLKYIAERFLKLNKVQNLIGELQYLLICKESKEHHDILTSINWKKVYTTNYDDVFEQSSKKNAIPKIPVDLSKNPRDFFNQRNIVIHLNGFIHNLSKNTLNNEFKLTNVSYLTDDFIHSNWIQMFKQDLDSSKAVFFVGFSLDSDLDLARIIHSYDKSKMFFIISPKAKEKDINKLAEYGEVLPIGISEFANIVKTIKETYTPIEIIDNNLYCFDYYYKNDFETSDITDKDIMDLFMRGNISLKHIYNKVPYFVERTKLKDIVNQISKNTYKFFIIEATLGNGKTCLLNSLIIELSKDNHVFLIKDDTYEISNDIDKIITQYKGKKIIIFDNYFLYYSVLKVFNFKNIDDITFIFTARSYLNDVNSSKLFEYDFFDVNKATLINITKLDFNEVKQIERLLMQYHMWPFMKSYSTKDRYIYIRKTHKNEIKNIVLELFEHSKIKDEYNKLINNVVKDYNMEKLLILSIINKLIPLNLSYDDICFIIDYRPNISIKVPEIKELINIQNNSIVIESSILAEQLLKEYSKSGLMKLTEFLIDIMKRADEYKENRKYNNLKRLLISASNIELIFDKKRHKEMIIKYYENIKNLEYCKNNYFFWLQYGITRLDLEQYDESELCFSNARESIKNSLDKNRAFDTFQLDTHYARFIIQDLIHRREYKGSLEAFLQAHKLIVDNNNKFELWHYPLKIANHYSEFYETFKGDMTDSDRAIFMTCCIKVVEKINLYIERKEEIGERGHYYVLNARNNILKTLEKLRNIS